LLAIILTLGKRKEKKKKETSGNLNGDKILERFGHFLAINVEMPRVQEVIDPLRIIEVGLKMISIGSYRFMLQEVKWDYFKLQIVQSRYHGGGRPNQFLLNECLTSHPADDCCLNVNCLVSFCYPLEITKKKPSHH